MYMCALAMLNFVKCQTEDGKELARVCLIDYASGVVIYDKLVRPNKPITDYLTRYVHYHAYLDAL